MIIVNRNQKLYPDWYE